jgi:alkyldihydroxyacetonephosphate synthase
VVTGDRGYGGTVNRRRKHWGWGYEDERPSGAELRESAATFASILGFGATEPEAPVPLERCTLPAPQLTPPPALAQCCDASDHARARRSYGSSYRDVLRGFRGDFHRPPDVVAIPRDEPELERVLEWAIGAGAAVIPYGGGTGVAGGVEPNVDRDRFEGVVTIDLSRFDRVLEVDPVSQTARIEAGATGPWLEHQLREHRLTLRHYPQSYTLATLGGMIATRASGHSSTRTCHIDDLVEAIRAVTPTGIWQSQQVPSSGAGPSPDRMLLGSEGTLGLITEAWVRVRPRPLFDAEVSVRFPDFSSGAAGVREIVQAALGPTQCRLLDPTEARLSGTGDGSAALLVLGYESWAHTVKPRMQLALECCADHGGEWDTTEMRARSGGDTTVLRWRDSFIRGPYLRDVLVAMGVIAETFETAITWDRFEALHESVTVATTAAMIEVCGDGVLACRFTHVYPDGPALYWTVLAPGRRGEELEQWDAIKRAATDAVIAGGGTITHHHAVGRDHRPWYDRQRPEPFAAALRAAKHAVDPTGALNPGVLIDAI